MYNSTSSINVHNTSTEPEAHQLSAPATYYVQMYVYYISTHYNDRYTPLSDHQSSTTAILFDC